MSTIEKNINLCDLKESFSNKENKSMKKHRKRSKKRKKSDPTVTNISNLLSNTLHLVSPENNRLIHRNTSSLPMTSASDSLTNDNMQSESQDVDKDDNNPVFTIENNCEVKVKTDCNDSNRDTVVLISEDSVDESSAKVPKRNAFEFMMESRNKSIGRNSPGKKIDNDVCNIPTSENKDKLVVRKLLLDRWASTKGSKKCKIEEREREIFVKHKLDERAKQMKKMLGINSKQSRKKINRICTDSEDSQDVPIKKNGHKLSVVISSAEENHTTIKKDKNDLKTEKRKLSEDKDFETDEEVKFNRENIIKIKMFSPRVFQPKKKLRKNLIKNEQAVGNLLDGSDDEFEKYSENNKSKLNGLVEKTRSVRKLRRKINRRIIIEDQSSNDSVRLIVNETGNNELKLNKTVKQTFGNISEQYDTPRPKRKLRKKVKKPIVDYSSNDFAIDKPKNMKNESTRISKKPKSEGDNLIIPYLVGTDCEESNNEQNYKKSNLKNDKNMILAPIFSQNSIKNDEIKGDLQIKSGGKLEETTENKSKLNETVEKRKKMNRRPIIDDDSSIDSVSLIGSGSENEKVESVRRSLRSKKPRSSSDTLLITYLIGTESEDELSGEQSNKKTCLKRNKNEKLAPIFLQSKPKPKIDPSVLEARRNFLLSSIPDALKRSTEKQQSVEDMEVNFFPEISHVQQKEITERGLDFWKLPKVTVRMIDLNIQLPQIQRLHKGSLNRYDRIVNMRLPACPPEKINNPKLILSKIKKNNPDYPVLRTFRLLKEKLDRCKEQTIKKPKTPVKNKKSKRQSKSNVEIIEDGPAEASTMWTEKYKALVYRDLMGNSNGTLELRKWLQNWLEVNENKSKGLRRCDSGSEFESDDGKSRDSTVSNYPGNGIVISGPHGSGKTMAVYALCNEFGINILELNASCRRTGKRLMQELQEATQSHQVRNKDAVDLNAEDSANNTARMCLLLIEDLDVVFEQDEGFLGALTQLLSSSKRPIVLVANEISSPNLQKIISLNPLIRFTALSPKITTVWLQILCLLEGCFINKNSLSELLEFNSGDVRKTLLQLQFWVQGGGGEYVNSSLNLIRDIKETSPQILCEDTSGNDISVVPMHVNCISSFSTGITLDRTWWNLPRFSSVTGTEPNPIMENSNLETALVKFSHYFDSLAEIDRCYSRCGFVQNSELSAKYSHLQIKDSIELSDIHEGFDAGKDFFKEWADVLLTGHMDLCKNTENVALDMSLPNSAQKRWRNKQRNCKMKFKSLVPPSNLSDHRAYALDYYPSLRTISRAESLRSKNSQKRRNRFFNYMNSLGLDYDDGTVRTANDVLKINAVNL